MALFHVIARQDGIGMRDPAGGSAADTPGVPARARHRPVELPPDRAAERLSAALAAAPHGAPVTVLIHGWRYDPGRPAHDPHALLFGADGARPGDWARGLGHDPARPETGVVIGWGWRARGPLAGLPGGGFASVHRRAAEEGARLRDLLRTVHDLRPDLRVGLLAHSLGARVALHALAAPGSPRAVLMGPAEHAAEARRLMRDARGAQVVCVSARANALFDLGFEALAPRPAAGRPGALGRLGLGPGRPDWFDLRLDDPRAEAMAAAAGLPLGPGPRRPCHWSFYTRPGALRLWAAMLREDRFAPDALRRAGWPELGARAETAAQAIAQTPTDAPPAPHGAVA